jgi:hypothetical protein
LPDKLSLGRTYAHTIVTAHVAEHTLTVDFPDGASAPSLAPAPNPSAASKLTAPTLTINPRPGHEIPGLARTAQSAGRPLSVEGAAFR